jgi:hypothetical protein
MKRFSILIFSVGLGSCLSCSNPNENYQLGGDVQELPWFYLEIPDSIFDNSISDTIYNETFDFESNYKNRLREGVQNDSMIYLFYELGNSTDRVIEFDLMYCKDTITEQFLREFSTVDPNSMMYIGIGPDPDELSVLTMDQLDSINKIIIIVKTSSKTSNASSPDAKFYFRASTLYNVQLKQ